MTSDEAAFFLNLAAIGGALLGLSFVTLSFFLVDLLKRYERTALPVFRSRDQDTLLPLSMQRPYSLTDYELFDGDPLVLFVSFSVGVTWLLFLLPLAMGLTAAWMGPRLGVLAAEMAALIAFLTFSFLVRNQQIGRLKPYLTREERLWPVLGWVVLLFYWGSTGIILTAWVSKALPIVRSLPLWSGWHVPTEQDAMYLIKVVCVGSLLLGTYTTNKDMFVFFKTFATERMRARWLGKFVKTYASLGTRVAEAISQIPEELQEIHPLVQLWNGGYPPMISTHAAFKGEGQRYLAPLWREIVEQRPGTASWMLDVPSIARWAEEVRELLEPRIWESPDPGDWLSRDASED